MKNNNLIGIALIVLIVVAGFIVYEKLPNKNQRTLSSSGTATIKSMPDEASIYVNIETLKSSAEESKNENSKISDKILDELYNLGIDKKSIETSSYNIYEEFDWSENGRKSLGFKTSNILKVKLTDFDLIGKVVDAAVNSGATGINNIDFELSEDKQKEIKKETLAKASQDAREKAEAIVNGLGASIKRIVSVSDTSYDYRPYPLFARGGTVTLEQAKTDIMPRELEVTANVNVVFEI